MPAELPELEAFVRLLHTLPQQLVLAVTGGGAGAIAEYLHSPGGSQTLLEAIVPYSAAALNALLGAPPENYCTARTACAMAMAAYQRARVLTTDSGNADVARPLAGIACTASLVSDRPKRGPHRIHAAWQTTGATSESSLTLTKGLRSRRAEEALATRLTLNQIAAAAGSDAQLPLDLLPDEVVTVNRVAAPASWQQLLTGERHHTAGDVRPTVLYPGAFNPLHAAHRTIIQHAAQRLGAPVTVEISVLNVDKPPLDYLEMQRRAEQFADGAVLFSRAATFVEKARLFPGVTFVVGADTIARVADARYYANAAARDDALAEIVARGCRFLVFGRLGNSGFMTVEQLPLPAVLQSICEQVSPEHFRADISSTALRRQRSAESTDD